MEEDGTSVDIFPVVLVHGPGPGLGVEDIYSRNPEPTTQVGRTSSTAPFPPPMTEGGREGGGREGGREGGKQSVLGVYRNEKKG